MKFTELTDMLGWGVLLGRPAAGSREGGGGLAGGDLSDPTTPHPTQKTGILIDTLRCVTYASTSFVARCPRRKR